MAEDWGLDLVRRGTHTYQMLCPNPKHQDAHLGSCKLTDNGGVKNAFHCFSCGAGGGPIDLVMMVDQVDFRAALKKIADRYGLAEKGTEEARDTRRWKGLSLEQYAHFGLRNPSIEVVAGVGEHEKPVYRHVSIRLRDLAREDPEAHDDLLVAKFLERSLLGAASFLSELDAGHLVWQDLFYSEAWLDAAIAVLQDDLALLKKGLMKPKRYAYLFAAPLPQAS